MGEIKVFASGGFKAAYLALVPGFESASGRKVLTAWGSSVAGAPTSIPGRLAAGEPVDLGGVHVGPGEVVLVSLSGANRDPSRYADPDRLDVGRDSSGHLALGHGIHYCLGAPLARLEAGIAISGLLARFGSISLAAPPASLRWRPSTLIHGLEALPVRLGPAVGASAVS